MTSFNTRAASCLVFVVVIGAFGSFDRSADAQSRRRPSEGRDRERSSRAEEEREALERLIDSLVKKLETRPGSVSSVIAGYNDVERKESISLDGRYRLHRELLGALRSVDDPALARAAASLLRTPSKTKFAGQVLMMKALVGEKFPAPREKRVEWLLRAVTGKHLPLAIWGLRLLGEAGWPEAVDALIEVMEDEESKGRAGATLWQLARGELYRIMGGRTGYATTVGEIRRTWERLDRTIPEAPDYDPGDEEDRPTATAVFFGDQISPRAVFLIDVSGSMKESVTLRPPGSAKTAGTAVDGEKDRGESLFGTSSPKIEVVKKELERAIGGLQPSSEFNVFKYSEHALAWKAPNGRLELVEADAANVGAAKSFARGLRAESGTNIYEALDQALGVPEVDTIYLLSDGAPSVGGDVDAIEANVARRNYLRGARIVTYGFAPENRGMFARDQSFDEGFMKRLAATHWGWYRRLNKARKPAEARDERPRERPRIRRRRIR